MSGPKPEGGLSILLAIRDNALGEATKLETEASDLESKAKKKRHEAEALREVHAKAAPYFPTPVTPLRAKGRICGIIG